MAHLYLLVLIVTTFGANFAQENEGHCTWYGECESSATGNKNCAYNGPPKPMKDPKGLEILKTYCPDLVKGSDAPPICCDYTQLVTLSGNMGLPQQFFLRCPSCYYNFLNLYCYSTCGAHQGDFLHINTSHPSANQNHTVIDSVDYFLTAEYAYGMFNSCKGVQMPSANEKALDIFCGRPAEECTPENWLSYMGSTANGHTPFGINFRIGEKDVVIGNDTYHPMNYTIVPCSKGYGNLSACSCQDCEDTCAPIPPPPAPAKECKLLHINCWDAAMGIVFLVFCSCFGTYVIFYNIMVRNSLDVNEPNYQQLSEDEDGNAYVVNGNGRPSRRKKRRQGAAQTSPVPMVTHADINCLEKSGAWMENFLQGIFSRWGLFCARHPVIIIAVGLVVAGGLSAGIALFQVTTDPVKLWSAKNSRARTEKAYFDSHFGPFYRTEQLIISRPHNHTLVPHHLPPPSEKSVNYSSLLDKAFLHMVLDLQLQVQNITATQDGETVRLTDICFQPLAPDNNNCTIESVLQYFQNSHDNLDKEKWDQYHFFKNADYLDHFQYCVDAPASTSDTVGLNLSCLATSSQPMFPWIVLGGFDGENYKDTEALVITFVVNNHVEDEKNAKAEAWEKEFIAFMKNFSSPNMTVSYSSERSIEDEINRESRSDVLTILISYIIMFLYVSFALGQLRDCSSLEQLIVDSKVTLGLAGVLIVLLSVSSSLGIYSYFGVAATLIIIEVVPFLVLAVGVDNIFILVQAFQRDKKRTDESLEEQIGRILGKVGPSMLLSSFSESVAFFLGALTSMPAVRVFSLYAAMAVLIDFLLQITVFVALMTLDAKRQRDNRFDACCFVKVNDLKPEESSGCLYYIMKEYYSHFLLKEWVRPIVMFFFVGWLCFSVALVHRVDIGLDQKLSMPDDSYVLDYFESLNKYLHVGAPVYFVAEKGLDYKTATGQNSMCGGNGCPQNSLVGQIYTASKQASYTRIAQPASSWIDDFFDWLAPGGNPPCCRIHDDKEENFCPATVPVNGSDCIGCPFGKKVDGRPNPKDFMKYLPWFLKDNPGTQCAKGGHAAYGSAVNVLNDNTEVGATYFMTYHTIMKTNNDYITALREARKIADNITATIQASSKTQAKVFPYSVFYVFYEQYLTIVHDTIFNLCTCLAAIFVVTFILLGFDFFSALMIVITVSMIVLDIIGFMYLWGVSLNAISLVNLVMSIGISVEFCAHITRAFAVSILPTKVERAKDALSHMGSSVLSGITLTKLGGILILALSKSQLFQVFYFRMYMGMVLFGATHGLIFLPVLLSYIGPPLNKAKLYQSQQKFRVDERSQLDHRGSPSYGSTSRYSLEEPPPTYNSVTS